MYYCSWIGLESTNIYNTTIVNPNTPNEIVRKEYCESVAKNKLD